MGEFRAGLEARGEYYLVGLSGEEGVLTEPPRWVPHRPTRARGRPAPQAYLVPDQVPIPLPELATRLERTRVCWRTGTKGPLKAEVAWVRVWPVHRWQNGLPAAAIPPAESTARWLLVE